MVLKSIIMLIGILFYLLSGPFIKYVLAIMSTNVMKTSDHIGLLIGYIERMLLYYFLYSENILLSDLLLRVSLFYDSMT